MTESTDTTEFEPGDFVHDADADHDNTLVVVRYAAETAEEYVAYTLETGEVTVADSNSDYPDDADVVEAAYIRDKVHDKSLGDVDGWREEDDLAALVEREGINPYAFPAGRLTHADAPEDLGDEKNVEEVLERIRDELENLGWDDVEVDAEEGVVVVDKFGEHRVYPDGTVEGPKFEEKLATAVDGVV